MKEVKRKHKRIELRFQIKKFAVGLVARAGLMRRPAPQRLGCAAGTTRRTSAFHYGILAKTDRTPRCRQPIQRPKVNATITILWGSKSLLGVLILLASVTSPSAPLLDAKSATPLAGFRNCFIQSQERSGRAWAYMPTSRGGTFTDSGARGARATYWLQVRGTGDATSLRLFAASHAGADAISGAVAQCR